MRINPSWEEIGKFQDPLTEGEKVLARFLDDSLSEDWKIFVRPYLNSSRPDIVILNPQVGVMIYTVKEWALDLEDNSNETSACIKQVNYYRNKIIGQIIPDMGEKIDEDKKLFALVQTGIYLHNINGESARELFNHCDYPVIAGFDDLTKENLNYVVPGAAYDRSSYMQKEWADEIELWLNPPFHSKRGALKLELTAKQKNHAKPKPGHRRIRGAAGSGKTLVIAYRAAKLAAEGQSVLVLTFNLTLWHYIKDMIAKAPFDFEWKNITFNHFHGFCNDILNELGILKPQGNYFDEIVPAVEGAISNNDIGRFKFDAILIDEGQDCKWEWYDLLSKFLNERDELLFVCDKNQNIYGRELSWIDNMGNVKFRGRWGELNTIYRLPRKIGTVANKFSETFGLDNLIETEEYAQLTLFERPPIFKWKNIKEKEWLQAVKDAYMLLKYQQRGFGEGDPSDIVILLPTKKMGMKAVKLFERRGIDANHVFEVDRESKYSRHKKAFSLGDNRLKISTIHSFKGWEAIHVIMLIPTRWNGDENLDSLVYTAMTRTQKNLIVLNCHKRYLEFGENLSNTSDNKKKDLND
jgi:superfamily I DNA/RNA helicase